MNGGLGLGLRLGMGGGGGDVLGPELATGLTLGTDVVDNGDGSYTIAASATAVILSNLFGSATGTYRMEFEIVSTTSGSIRPRVGSTLGTNRSTVDNFVEVIISTSSALLGLTQTSFNGVIRGLSYREVL